MADPLPTLAIVGGTGALGGGLARRWAAKGYPIVIGSRSAEKAAAAARALEAEGVAGSLRGLDNAAAAATLPSFPLCLGATLLFVLVTLVASFHVARRKEQGETV